MLYSNSNCAIKHSLLAAAQNTHPFPVPVLLFIYTTVQDQYITLHAMASSPRCYMLPLIYYLLLLHTPAHIPHTTYTYHIFEVCFEEVLLFFGGGSGFVRGEVSRCGFEERKLHSGSGPGGGPGRLGDTRERWGICTLHLHSCTLLLQNYCALLCALRMIAAMCNTAIRTPLPLPASLHCLQYCAIHFPHDPPALQ